MTSEFLFSTVYNLDSKELPGNRFQFFDHCYLSTDEKLLKGCFSKMAVLCVGACEQGAAVREGVFVYSDLPADLAPRESDTAIRILKGWLGFVRSFILALWFIKDNAIDCELGFVRWFSDFEGEMYSTNYIAALNFDARSERKKVAFSIEELRSARSLFQNEIFPAVMPGAVGGSRIIAGGNQRKP
jgi:hypothetical protein